jgi:lipid-binding SYLF domain-containing protein
MIKNNVRIPMVLALALVLGLAGVRAIHAKESAADEQRRAVKAAEVLTDMMGIPEEGIPNDLLASAHGIAVFPGVVKGAFIVGGEGGKGLVSQRRANGTWSAPSFVKIGGGNFGFQIGVQSTDLVLVFTSREGLEGLLNGKLKLGADASVAAGPVGRKAQVGTDVLLKSAVFAYSRSKGAFAGVSLDGSVVTIDDSDNRRAYGRDLTGHDILLGNVRPTPVVMPFVQALERYAPAPRRVTD